MISQEYQHIIVSKLKDLRPERIGIFGSFARQQNTSQSDLDILVFLPAQAKISLLKLIEVEQDLTESLGVKVDLVTERSLSPSIRTEVLEHLQVIFVSQLIDHRATLPQNDHISTLTP
jgi:uncharacterized protein